MPCRDEWSEAVRVVERDNPLLKSRLDAATRAACETLRFMEKNHNVVMLSPFVQDWWKRHKEEDARRLKRKTR